MNEELASAGGWRLWVWEGYMAKKLLGTVIGFLWDALSLATLVTVLILLAALLVGVLNKLGWNYITLQDLANIPYIGYILIIGVFSWLALMLLGALIMFGGSSSGSK